MLEYIFITGILLAVYVDYSTIRRVEHRTLGHEVHSHWQPSEEHIDNEVDRIEWRELLSSM